MSRWVCLYDLCMGVSVCVWSGWLEKRDTEDKKSNKQWGIETMEPGKLSKCYSPSMYTYKYTKYITKWTTLGFKLDIPTYLKSEKSLELYYLCNVMWHKHPCIISPLAQILNIQNHSISSYQLQTLVRFTYLLFVLQTIYICSGSKLAFDHTFWNLDSTFYNRS